LSDFREIRRKAVLPDTTPLHNQSGDATLRLLRMLVHNEWSKSFSSIGGNFLVAALHLACMKDLSFTSDSYPDLPDKFEGFTNG
jgi:hypothetical protein